VWLEEDKSNTEQVRTPQATEHQVKWPAAIYPEGISQSRLRDSAH